MTIDELQSAMLADVQALLTPFQAQCLERTWPSWGPRHALWRTACRAAGIPLVSPGARPEDVRPSVRPKRVEAPPHDHRQERRQDTAATDFLAEYGCIRQPDCRCDFCNNARNDLATTERRTACLMEQQQRPEQPVLF